MSNGMSACAQGVRVGDQLNQERFAHSQSGLQGLLSRVLRKWCLTPFPSPFPSNLHSALRGKTSGLVPGLARRRFWRSINRRGAPAAPTIRHSRHAWRWRRCAKTRLWPSCAGAGVGGIFRSRLELQPRSLSFLPQIPSGSGLWRSATSPGMYKALRKATCRPGLLRANSLWANPLMRAGLITLTLQPKSTSARATCSLYGRFIP